MFDPLRCINDASNNGKIAKLLIKEPKPNTNKSKRVDTAPLTVIQPIPPSIHLDGIIAQHAISEDPYWFSLHHNMATPTLTNLSPILKLVCSTQMVCPLFQGLTKIIIHTSSISCR